MFFKYKNSVLELIPLSFVIIKKRLKLKIECGVKELGILF